MRKCAREQRESHEGRKIKKFYTRRREDSMREGFPRGKRGRKEISRGRGRKRWKERKEACPFLTH